jgi:hypothetical protein
MPAPQAKFEFVATGDAAVNAQIEQVVNKLVKMKLQAKETTESAAEGMEKARMSTHLLNEELGLHIPRAMQKIMAGTPGLSKALSMAFSVTAAVGFVEIIGTLIDKMPELTNAFMGFGEEAQKVFADLKTANAGIQKAIEDNQKQALADMLLGLSGSALDKGQLDQLIAQRDQKIEERTRVSKGSMHVVQAERIGSMKIPMHTVIDPEAQKEVQNLTAEITRLDGAIASAGKHLTHDLGDEGKKRLEDLANQARVAKEAISQIFAKHDNQGLTQVDQAVNAEDAAYNKELAALKTALETRVITQLQFNVRERQLTADHMSALQKIYSDGWDKIVNAVPAGDGAIPQILFAGLDPFEGLRKSFSDTQRLIQAGLEEEAAKEKVISDTAKATGEDQYTTEQKLQEIRGNSAAQLQAMADKMEQIAHTMGDAGMIAEADKLEAKLQDLRVKTASWGTELKKATLQDGENLFVGLASGAEGWAQAFQNAGQSILAELAKIIYKLYIVKLLQAAINGIGGMFGGGGSDMGISDTGSGLSSISSGIGSLFGGGRASGGPVLPGMTYMVGEQGPEPLMMGRNGGFILPHSSGGGGRGGAPIVNIHNYGQPMEQQQTSHFDGQQYVVDVVVKDIQTNGAIGQLLRR